jgi:hypothetical protein
MSWIKMRTNLRTAPKVVRMASALKADRLRIIGGLWAAWSIFDEHSVDGTLQGYTLAALDEDLGWRGFSAALADVAWLEETEAGLILPEFEEHNGASAKRRATDSKRKSEGRDADKSYGGSWNVDGREGGQMSAPDADKKQTRVEQDKRKNKPLTPSPGFADFWSAWPKSPRKGEKSGCVKLWEEGGLEVEAPTILAHVKAMAATDGWRKQAGEFVPAPAVYLRNRRWDGADMGDGVGGDDPFAGAR